MRKLLVLLATLLVGANALAQGFPSRAIHVVVPFAAGGGADVVTRILMPKVSELLGQTIIIENRAGAGGNIGAEYVAKAAPDGYTLLVATGAQAINTTLTKNLSWDLKKDFVPVAFMVKNQHLLAVHPSIPASNVRELIALAKSKPGQITYASYGAGSTAHLSAELFKMMAGVDMLHVPYKGAAPAVNDLLGGQVNLIFADVAAILPHAKAGKVRSLAIGSSTRFSGLPDVPTVAESGVPGFETGGFLALVAPAGTPQAAVDKINAAVVKAMGDPDIRRRIEDLAGIPMVGTPAELGRYLTEEVDKWAKVIETAMK